MVSIYGPEAIQRINSFLESDCEVFHEFVQQASREVKSFQNAQSASSRPGDDYHCQAVINWLFSLSPESRQAVLTIHDAPLVSFFLQIYRRKVMGYQFDISFKAKPQQSQDKDPIKKYFSIRMKSSSAINHPLFCIEKDFQEHLLITDTQTYLDTLTLDPRLVQSPQQLLDFFNQISTQRAFSRPCKQLKQRKSQWELPEWLEIKIQAFRTFASWVVAFLEQSVWKHYWGSLRKKIEHPQRKAVQISAYWRDLIYEKQVESIGSRTVLERQFQQVKQVLSVCHDRFIENLGKTNQLSEEARNKLLFYQTSESVSVILQRFQLADPQSFIQFLAYSPLSRALTTFDVLTRIVLKQIYKLSSEDAINSLLQDINQPPKEKILIKKKSKTLSESSSSSTTSSMLIQEEISSSKKPQSRDLRSHFSRPSDFSNQSGFQTVVNKKHKKKLKPEFKKNYRPKRPHFQRAQKQHQIPHRVEKQVKTVKSVSLHQQISETCTQILQAGQNKAHTIWTIIHHISQITNSIFPRCEIQLFGSYQAGIALQNSDIDLIVNWQNFISRAKTQSACQSLAKTLQVYPWASQIKSIPTASIPVVKLQVSPEFFTNNLLPSISVDITFDGQFGRGAHLGQASTQITKYILLMYPPSQFLALILKLLLSKHNLNNSYTGGLGSYSLVLWIVAYINNLLEVPEDLGELLIGFLKCYGTEFDSKKTGVSIVNGRSFFPLKTPYLSGAVTIDPIKPTNDTTRSSYNIHQVLNLFRQVYHSLSSGASLLNIIN